MTEDVQIACGVALSICSALTSFALAWTPIFQLLAVIVAIVSGLFAIGVSITKLIDWSTKR